MEQRLIDANALNRKDVNCANFPMNFIDIAPTVLTIPENPTNGDMIKAMFPNIEMWGEILDYSLGGMIHRVLKSWWNALYTKEKCLSN